MNQPKISDIDLMDLVHWARRYCDGRSTYAPSSFNNVYARIQSENPDLIRCKDRFDSALTEDGKYWPYAQDGMYDPQTGVFDSRPKNYPEQATLSDSSK